MEEQKREIIDVSALEELLVDASSIPDDETESSETDERQDIEIEKLRVQVAQQKEELEGRRQDRLQRGDFSYHIFALLWFYLISVLGIVISVASGIAKLSDPVLITLLSTTTANVIGIFYFVAKYLFHTKE